MSELTEADVQFLDQFEVEVKVVADRESGVIHAGTPEEAFVDVPVHRVLVTMKVRELIAEVVVPDSMSKSGMSREVGNLIIERMQIDLMEGMVSALHKERSVTFPTYNQYMVHLDKQSKIR